MSDSHQLAATFQTYMENPLLWPIFEVLKRQPSGWKVHTLAAHLSELGIILSLRPSAGKRSVQAKFPDHECALSAPRNLAPRKMAASGSDEHHFNSDDA